MSYDPGTELPDPAFPEPDVSGAEAAVSDPGPDVTPGVEQENEPFDPPSETTGDEEAPE